MISDIETCGIEDTQNHIPYLEQTPVRGLADLLRQGDYILKKGNITSVKYLGSLKTEFGSLGGFSSDSILGQERFLVKQVLNILRRSECSDKEALTSIEYFMDRDDTGELEIIITIFRNNSDYIIKDGNKRAVAFYERRKENAEDTITFPVFIIQPRNSIHM